MLPRWLMDWISSVHSFTAGISLRQSAPLSFFLSVWDSALCWSWDGRKDFVSCVSYRFSRARQLQSRAFSSSSSSPEDRRKRENVKRLENGRWKRAEKKEGWRAQMCNAMRFSGREKFQVTWRERETEPQVLHYLAPHYISNKAWKIFSDWIRK